MDNLIHSECVVLDIKSKCKGEVIRELISLLVKDEVLSDDFEFLKVILDREKIFPTSIGNKVAIPHGISQYVKEPRLCIGRLTEPVLWDKEKNEYVLLVILIAIPLKNAHDNTHIKIISCLMRNLMHESYINQLLTSDKEMILKLLKEGFNNDKKIS